MQKFKVASNVFNLQIILPQTNPNVFWTHYLQYKKNKYQNQQKMHNLGRKWPYLKCKVFVKAIKNQQPSTPRKL
jgi:hypothetical protein